MSDEQGVMTECVYCTSVRPDIGAECPFCGGRRTYFQPGQMMDGPTSREQTMHRLFELADSWNDIHSCAEDERPSVAEQFRGELVSLLQEMSIHNFDARTAVVELIRKIEDW